MTELFSIEGVNKLYDLSCGYLGDDHIGTYDGQVHIYSAEAFLNDVDRFLTQEDRSSFYLRVKRVTVPDEKIWYKAGMH